MSHVTKNYTTDGGDKTVIGGSLVFEEGATVERFPGGNKLAANQIASAATNVAELVADFNALLTKLKAAGLMAAD